MAYRLEAAEVTGAGSWLWRLYDQGGNLIAHHQVQVDPNSWERQALGDLALGVAQQADPGDRLGSEATLAAQIGVYTAQHVLGPVAAALADAAPVTVTVVVPADQAWLLGLPLTIAVVDGRTLAARRVCFAGTVAGQALARKEPVGGRLRVLAVYSVPAGQALLDLRRERKGLGDLVGRLTGGASNAAIDLRILQYGATAEKLQAALAEDDGWDIVHFSGHGASGHIVLEDPTGRPHVVDTAQLVGWLGDARHHLKLVSLTACSSAAFTVTQTLRHLGIQTPDPKAAPEPAAASLGLALDIARSAQCAVVAMRYPVVDDFAVDFALSLFAGLWDKNMAAATAVGWAVQQVAPDRPTFAAPALSAYTPAVFGVAAPDLRVTPPRAATVGPVDTAMAGFEPEPTRFVGRNPIMTRANAALAPLSGASGVIFYGMAGAGKTACGLELAYGQRANFAELIWAKAPPDGLAGAGGDPHAAATELTRLAGRLDLALGVALADKIHDPTLSGPALEELAEAMRLRATLVVIDNAESLLTAAGAWLDPHWGHLIDALTAHSGRGLGRLVLTTRRPPTPTPAGMVVEAVHALNRDEAILMALQLPNLGRLLGHQPAATVDTRWQLARTILETSGGHPKLLELADAHATHPDTLQTMLTGARHAWDHAGIDPIHHLTPTAGTDPIDPMAGYLAVLGDWTTQAVAGLDPATVVLAQLLCRCDPDDRNSQIIENNWADLWHRLDRPDPHPDPQPLLTRLADAALIEAHHHSDGDSYDIHPVVAAAIAATTPDNVSDAVDHQLAAYWNSVARQALDAEAAGQATTGLVVYAARHAVTYLLRLHQWDTAQAFLERAVNRDQSPAGRSEMVGLLRQIADQTAGTDTELPALVTVAVTDSDPDQAEQLLRRVETEASASGRHQLASIAAGGLANLLQDRGRYRDALDVVDRTTGHIGRAGLGPWTQLANQAHRLQLQQLLGDNQQVLTTIAEFTDHLASLPDRPAGNETALPWNVRETLFDIAGSAAQTLERWDDALRYDEMMVASKEARGAPPLELATTRFNAYTPLMRNRRTDDARALLDGCRAVFEAHDAHPQLAMCLGALADLENTVGHRRQAVDLQQVGLRFGYLQPDPRTIAASHHNLANYLARADDPLTAVAHRLAAATIYAATGSGSYADTLRQVAADLASGVTPPANYQTLCATVEATDGVHYHQLIDSLGGDGDRLLALVVDQAASLQLYPDQLAAWEATLALLVAATTGNRYARTHLDADLDRRGQHPDWAQLTERLAQVRDGAREPGALTAGLAPVGTAIITRALDAVAGHTILDPAPGLLELADTSDTVDWDPGLTTDPGAVEVAAPPEADAEPGGLYWVSDLPDDHNALSRGVLFVGSTYRASTRFSSLRPDSDDPARVSALGEGFVGTKVRFAARGDGLAVRRVGDSGGFGERVRGELTLCRDDGTDALLVDCRADRAGPARLSFDVEVNGVPLPDVQRLSFSVVDFAAPNPVPAVAVESPRTPMDRLPTAAHPVFALKTGGLDKTGQVRMVYESDPADPISFLTAANDHDIGVVLGRVRRTLNALARSYDTFEPRADDVLALASPDEALLAVARVGAEIHKALFGLFDSGLVAADTRDVAQIIASTGRADSHVAQGCRVMIEDDGVPFPWAIVYDGCYRPGRPKLVSAADVDPSGFWGYRFSIDRMVRRHRRGPTVGPQLSRRSAQAIVNQTIDPPLAGTDGRISVLPAGLSQSAAITTGGRFLEWLNATPGCDGADLVYFYCHADPAASFEELGFMIMRTSDDQARLIVDDSATGTVTVAALAEAASPRGNPVVFLTACAAGGGDPAFASPFARAFIQSWDSRSLVASDAEVPASFGRAFSAEVLADFQAGNRQIGESLAAVTRDLLKPDRPNPRRNPFGLFFGLHGRPEVFLQATL